MTCYGVALLGIDHSTLAKSGPYPVNSTHVNPSVVGRGGMQNACRVIDGGSAG